MSRSFKPALTRMLTRRGQTVQFDAGDGVLVDVLARVNRGGFRDIETGEMLVNRQLLVIRNDELDAAGHDKPHEHQHFIVEGVARGVLGAAVIDEGGDTGAIGYKIWVEG